MALLQISEPGASPEPHARRIAVGIDLGTTHSLVAAVRSGVAECLPDRDGEVLLASAVRYRAGGGVEVGRDALAGAIDDPKNTIVSVKRLMGRGLRDLSAAGRVAYDFDDDPGMVRLRTAAGIKSPVQVSAEILATLRQRAEDTFDAPLYGAVVTVPAYFDDAQRQATKDAAELAGLDVLRLISEPTAASIAYGLDNASEGLYAVYDLGGGTFDISLLRMTKGVFEVVATGGDSALGGDDIDAALADWALAKAAVPAVSAGERRAALLAARAAKESLSGTEQARFHCDVGGKAIDLTIARAELEAVAGPFVARTIAAVRAVVRDAKVARDAIDGIVLVGGSTRMPLVRKAVQEFFGRAPLTNLDPDQVVALGAARQADALAGNAGAGELLLLDVVALSLGIETMGGLVERIIERNSPIPTARAQSFTTFQDGQAAMAIHVVQGERDLVVDCRSLARFELHGIPPMVAGAARIEVTFTVDADGLLSVEAREATSGVEASVTVKPSYGLSDDEVTRMLQEGFGHAEADMAARALREAQVDADRLLGALASALASDGELLAAGERKTIDALVGTLRSARGGADRDAIEQAMHALSDATEDFAAERMNRGIRRALAGRRVEDL
ncbi:MAG TPA: Fe-S protein assembly chaperone HscA [Caldimonas sp.]|jgi:molecular chaperone HscA|nr:Fe-S protein assembly chaperone HscA [Caldimonas sp.]HEX4234604.1 Fe-S protein assembly chaperone HscA [Caldimonas sp.]